jgi:hypothetical protein
MATVLWKTRTSPSNQWDDMPPMTSFGGDGEDLDNNSFRSIATGNINRKIVSKSWTKTKHVCDHLTDEEFGNLLERLRVYPLYIAIKAPVWNTEWFEFQGYCSKYSWDLNQDGSWKVTFNIVQGKKVSGQ